MQICSYVILVVKAHKRDKQDLLEAAISHEDPKGDGTDALEATYSKSSISNAVSSIVVALFLVLTFAAADFRAAWALLSTRSPSNNIALGISYNGVLGIVLLSSFVLLVLASVRVLFFVADDDVNFIVGAATVLFISDLVRDQCSDGSECFSRATTCVCSLK